MKKTLLNVVAVVPLLAAAFIAGMQCGDEKSDQSGSRNCTYSSLSPTDIPAERFAPRLPSCKIDEDIRFRRFDLSLPNGPDIAVVSVYLDQDADEYYQIEWNSDKSMFQVRDEKKQPQKQKRNYWSQGIWLAATVF